MVLLDKFMMFFLLNWLDIFMGLFLIVKIINLIVGERYYIKCFR